MLESRIALASICFAVTVAPATAAADLDIVTTVPDLAAIAKSIGGDKVKVTSLALPSQNPHFVDAKPSLALKVNRADMLVAVGLQLELGWLPVLQVGARNAKVGHGGDAYMECGDHVDRMDVPKGKVSRADGDIHPEGNPHFLYDPRRAKQCAQAMADKMASLDPDNSKRYEKGLEGFVDDLDEKIAGWNKRMKRHRGTPVVTYHKSWVYLNDWLGLKQIANLEPKPGVPPSPRHVVKVIKAAKRKKVKLIFQESYYPNKTGKLVAKKVKAKLVKLSSGTSYKSGETYAEHMERVVSALEKALPK